jgi:hypothetical protein
MEDNERGEIFLDRGERGGPAAVRVDHCVFGEHGDAVFLGAEIPLRGHQRRRDA